MQSERVFVKQHGEFTTRDWQRVVWFHNMVEAVPGLRTARPLWSDADGGTIGYEHLGGLTPLLQSTDEVADKLPAIATRLRALHAVGIGAPREPGTCMALSGLGISPGDAAQLEAGLPYGVFWGDCWHGNIFMPKPDDVVFLDPLPNRWMFEPRPLWASGAVDLAMLRMSLYLCHPLRAQLHLNYRRISTWVHSLTRSYLDACGTPELAGPVHRLTIALAERYIAAYRLRLPPTLALAKRALSLRSLAWMKHSSAEAAHQ